MRFVFNADDFGLSKGVNEGILHCYQSGAITSASLMTNTLFFEDAVALIHQHGLPNNGLHVNLTEFKSILTSHKTIVDGQGNFMRNIADSKQIDYTEVYAEIEAQYQKALSNGVKITHLDSHHHVHMSYALRKPFIAFAQKNHLPLRKINFFTRNPFKWLEFKMDTRKVNYYTDSFSADFYDDTIKLETLLQIVKQNPKGTLEIMCHPGYVDAENGVYNLQRQLELDVLTSDKIIELIQSKNNQ
jgi:predicted glycoside hydrolase/deacetylase ChbG (UPF0249 family)